MMRARILFPAIMTATGMIALAVVPASAQQVTGRLGSPDATTTVGGNQLPAPPPEFGGVIRESWTDSKPWWPPRIVPPKGAPNILLILTDDEGYGISSVFGGVIPTPTAERVARSGIRYTNMNNAALCSPTRAALITGRNHHSAGFGVIAELSTGYPGYDSAIGVDNGTIGRILSDNGYATSWFGKNHNTPSYQLSTAGPFHQWPTGMGFQYFYGYMGGETDQYQPFLFKGTSPIFPWIGKPGYNLITDMADEAISHIRSLNAAAPEQPFLVYYCPGASHAPHQPPKEWIDKFKGKFDMGWNRMREQIFANQKRLGVVPPDTQLTPWPDVLPQWDSLTDVQKKLYAHQAEVFAAYTAYSDHEIGRVIQSVADMGKLDNTLVIFLIGDNGTSAEGSMTGTYNRMTAYNGVAATPEALNLLHYEDWGSQGTAPHFAVPWSWAFDTPFKWTKQVASHFGGTRGGMIISWPARIKDAGGIRHQFHHIIDVMPTILEATGIKAPEFIDGIRQKPIDGVSMVYTFDKANANAPSTHKTQYFEMAANRGIYNDGWYANTTPAKPPWDLGGGPLPSVLDYKWELYNLNEDFSQYDDLAAKMPEKLKEMQAIFDREARRFNVYPLDNRAFARATTPRPSATAGKTVFTYSGVNPGIPSDSAPNILGRSFTITADIEVPAGGAEGMIVTEGGRFAGYALYLLNGKPVFVYNLLDMERFRWEGGVGVEDWLGRSLGSGRHTIEFDFTYAGPGIAKGGTGVMKVDGRVFATKEIKHTIAFFMPPDETFDVGTDLRTPVDGSYSVPFTFTGKISSVAVKIGPSQLTAEDQRQAQEALARARD